LVASARIVTPARTCGRRQPIVGEDLQLAAAPIASARFTAAAAPPISTATASIHAVADDELGNERNDRGPVQHLGHRCTSVMGRERLEPAVSGVGNCASLLGFSGHRTSRPRTQLRQRTLRHRH
jgi:hypothetical protein